MRMPTRTRSVPAWSLWLATFGCCAAGLAVTLAVTRPLTAGVLVQGAVEALAFRLGFATVGQCAGPAARCGPHSAQRVAPPPGA